MKKKEVDRLGQSRKRGKNSVQVTPGDEAQEQSRKRTDEADRNALEDDLLNDMSARHADRPHHRDLADSLVDRDCHQCRDQQKSNEQTDAAEYHRELAEVSQALIYLIERGLGGDDVHGEHPLLDPSPRRFDIRPFPHADHEQRRSVGAIGAAHPLESREPHCRSPLVRRTV